MPMSLFSKELEWSCLVCGDLRPDAYISVRRNVVEVNGLTVQHNIRFCNDRPECIDGAKKIKLIQVEVGN